MHFKLPQFAFVIYLACVSAKILFNQNELIIEFKSFSEIQDLFVSGDLSCGLDDESLDVDTNKFNGTHVIFSYDRVCFIKSDDNYTKPEDVYTKPYVCYLKFADPVEDAKRCNVKQKLFAFNDTCSIEFEKACKLFGPCIGQYTENRDNDTSSEAVVSLNLGNDTVEFTTKAIHWEALGKVIFCDRFEHTWKNNEKQFDDGKFVLFRFGEGTCGISKLISDSCPCCYPVTFDVQAKYGNTLNNKPVNKTDSFSK